MATTSSFCVCSFEGCNAVYKKPAKLKEHMRSHTGERPFACSEPGCDKTFTRKRNLSRHELSHSGVKQVRCTWAGCSDQFVSTTNLKKHIARKHQHQGKPYKCTHADCGKGFKKHRDLTIHEYEHTGVLPFPCDKCNKRFLLPSKLKSHLKVHRGHKCEVCGKEFSMQCRLTQHALIHSPSRDVFPCPFKKCKRSYTKMSNLKTHIQSYHESKRPFTCTQQDCSKTFAHEISLRRHVKAVHDANASLPPRKKKNYAAKLLGFKEPPSLEEDVEDPPLIQVVKEVTTPDNSSKCDEPSEQEGTTSQEKESSVDSTIDKPAAKQSPQKHTDEDMAEGSQEKESSIESTIDKPGIEQSPQKSTDEDMEQGSQEKECSVESTMDMPAVEQEKESSIESTIDKPAVEQSPQKHTDEDMVEDSQEKESCIESTIDKPAVEQSSQKSTDGDEGSLLIGAIEYVDEGVCMDGSKNEATGDRSCCDETTEAKGSDGREQLSEDTQLRVMV
ncbi:transcription factor IIIA-like isoform X2 [Branchiostoma floridae]|uniref:Transcription factor IIIA-like isoform X2 n=1 Tax=Branchiostoma floridae TaxID=7739 RepID=A0A9J7LHX9_BRAFL|nr:transcription factor IIIA-like isoform X2 [Branchiostoma floridae]